MNPLLNLLTRNVTSGCGQVVLSAYGELHESLAMNQNLNDDTWFALWNAKPKVARATALVSHELNAGRVAAVVAREKRVNVLGELVKHSRLTEADGRRLIDRGVVTDTIAKLWFDSGRVPAKLEREVAWKAGPERRAQFVARHPELSDQDALDTIGKSFSPKNESVAAVIDARPHLLPELLRHETYRWREAALASRHLFDEELMLSALDGPFRPWELMSLLTALANNPNTPAGVLAELQRRVTDTQPTFSGHGLVMALKNRSVNRVVPVTVPWEQVTDDRQTATLLHFARWDNHRMKVVSGLENLPQARREKLKPFTLPNEKPSPVSEWTPENADQVNLGGRSLPPRSLPAVTARFERDLDAAGPQAWESAAMLLKDGFDGTLGDLLTLARAL